MAEREVEVLGHEGGRLRLRLLGSACDGCRGGCAGRCQLFAGEGQGDGELLLPVPDGVQAAVGERFRLALDDEALRRAAWRGYGVALAGLLVGACAGRAAGIGFGHADVLTLAGLLAGTFLAVLVSKRHVPEPRLSRAGSGALHPQNE